MSGGVASGGVSSGMSVGAQAETAGRSVPGVEAGGAAPADTAARLLGRLTVLPALLLMAWLLAGLPLLLAGGFTPVAVLVVSVPEAGGPVPVRLRLVTGPRPAARAAARAGD